MKNREICELRRSLNDCKILQYDGIDLDLSTTDTENVEDSDDSLDSQKLYLCELCDFKTTNRNGLRVHNGRKHKHNCDECGKSFSSKENLQRHEKAEMILKNSDPLRSPDASKTLCLNDYGEPFIEVVDSKSLCLVAALSFENQDDIETDAPLVAIHLVVLGDLREPGCLVDWASLSSILETHLEDKTS